MNTKQTFYINGTKCQSCKIIIEEELIKFPEISQANVDLESKSITIIGDSNYDSEDFLKTANQKLEHLGYEFSTEPATINFNLKNFLLGVFFAVIFLALFFKLQDYGLESSISSNTGSYFITPFLIGIVASLSSCLAVVGGLVLSLSSHYARTEKSWRPQIGFHTGRILGFAFIGGLLGLIGSIFQISIYTHAIINLIVGLFMLSNGLSLIEGFKISSKLSVGGLFLNFAMRYAKTTGNFIIPFGIGIVTFFLPCGFTQSMQLFALQSGSFTSASTIMIAFALGTLPVLALITYTSRRFSQSRYSPIFFNAAACVIIFLGLHSIYSVLVILNLT